MMRRLCLFLLVYSFLPLGIAQQGIIVPGGTEVEWTDSLYDSVVVPDRTLSRRLEQADRLFEAGRSAEAAQLLGGILESADFSFRVPEKTDKKEEGEEEEKEKTAIRTLRQTINDYIIDRLRTLPKEARDSYAFQFEPTAKRLLDDAVAAGSLDDIQQVARKYFPTSSGAAATFIVGLTQFERGDYAAASLTLDRLQRQHTAIPDTVKPVLEQTLAELQNKLQNIAEPAQIISDSAWIEQIGWRMPSGSPAQNSGTAATVPLLEQNWTVPISNQFSLKREIDALTRLMKSRDDVYIPASQPLVVGDLFITQTMGEIIAVDANTGKRLWIAAEPEYRFPEGTSGMQRPINFVQNPRSTLRHFLWHDRISHQLSSDGERLFGIDEHDLRGSAQIIPGRPINLAGRGEDRRFDPGSTLTARDLKTGSILWQVGKFPYVQKYIDASQTPRPRGENARPGPVNVDESIFTDDEKTLRETWFLGAPLPLQGRLYVIGETDSVLQLFVLESQTGRLIARQPFAQVTSSFSMHALRRTYPLFPSASGGLIICPSGTGLITALDATTLAPVWCYTYANERTPNLVNRNAVIRGRGQLQQLPADEPGIKRLLDESGCGWQVPGIIIDGQRVLVAPSDRAVLYCLNLFSGTLIWEQSVSRVNTLYVAGIQDNKAFVVTPGNIMAIDMSNGDDLTKDFGIRFPAGLNPTGVGVRSGEHYFVPLTDAHLAVADLMNSKLTLLNASGKTNLPAQNSEYVSANDLFPKPIQFGNLVGIKGRFFSQSPAQIACFDQKEPLRQRAETRLSADVNDPEGLLQRGRILKSEGKLAEAVDAFRASLKAKPTPLAADLLRKILLEAMRNDYPVWSHAGPELESLVEFPDEWGTILYAQIEGILQSGQTGDLAPVLEKVFAFGQDQSVLIPVSGDHSAQLHRAIGGLIEQAIAKGNRPGIKAAWEELAETFLQQLSGDTGEMTPPAHTSSQSLRWMQNSVYLPPEVQRLSMFIGIFRNTAAAKKSKQTLREAYQRHRLPLALDLQDKPSAVLAWSELPAPFDWQSKTVTMQMDSAIPPDPSSSPPAEGDANRKEINRLIDSLLRIAKEPGVLRTGENLLQLPFFGTADSELAAFDYAVQSGIMGDLFLCCYDSLGRERWQLELPMTNRSEYQGTNNPYNGEFVSYIKGFQHILLCVRGTCITAIDTTPQSEKVLWSKTFPLPFPAYQNSLKIDQNQRPQSIPFPKNSVFVSPHAVCCWNTNCAYGLDPLTGQTLWVRRTPHDNCSILGDEENLFLVFPDVRQVVAVDPVSGRELADGPLPPGGTYVYGTNVVFVQGQGNDYTLGISDLRDIHNKRQRALQIADAPEGKLGSGIPVNTLHDKVRNTSMLQTMQNDRFLSVAAWETKSLQIYDLQTKKKLLPEENKILEFVPEEKSPNRTRCDVELMGDRLLVLFTKDSQLPNTPVPHEEAGLSFRRRFQMIPGVLGHTIGEGTMMLFDSEGRPCWQKPVIIEKFVRLQDIPNRLPVMLFAVAINDQPVTGGKQYRSVVIRGIDKRSGEIRFSKMFTENSDEGNNENNIRLQPFRVSTDPAAREIIFTNSTISPPRWVKAVFTDDPQ